MLDTMSRSTPLTSLSCNHPATSRQGSPSWQPSMSNHNPAGEIAASKPTYSGSEPTAFPFDALNTVALVSGILISPSYALTQLPAIAVNPLLRTVGNTICILQAASCLSAALLRIRLKNLRKCQLVPNLYSDPSKPNEISIRDTVVEGYCSIHDSKNIDSETATSSRQYSHMILSSPAILFTSSLMFSPVVMMGYTWNLGAELPPNEDLRRGPVECAFIGSALLLAAVYCGMVQFVFHI